MRKFESANIFFTKREIDALLDASEKCERPKDGLNDATKKLVAELVRRREYAQERRKPKKLEKLVPCRNCGGKGTREEYDEPGYLHTCEQCNGRGSL